MIAVVSSEFVGKSPICVSRFAADNPTAERMFAAVVCVAAFVACVTAVDADAAAELAELAADAIPVLSGAV